jgi:hypothetical protein
MMLDDRRVAVFWDAAGTKRVISRENRAGTTVGGDEVS